MNEMTQCPKCGDYHPNCDRAGYCPVEEPDGRPGETADMTASYHAYHCLYCDDTGSDDGMRDPTLADNVNRRVRPCGFCDGFGAILIGARWDKPGRRRKPHEGDRWPERDIRP